MASALLGRPTPMPMMPMMPTLATRSAAVDRGAVFARRQRQRPSTSSAASTSDATSFPPYEVVSKNLDYDLRLYAPHFAVECDYTRRDEGFERVGSYASGQNETQTRFVESQPVVMHFPPGTATSEGSPSEPKVMSLHIGPPLSKGKKKESSSSSSSEEETPPSTPPLPTREGVRLSARGGELIAAARVPAQYATREAALSAREALVAALKRDGLKLCERDSRGAFRLAQYGALFQLEERVNEVQLRVEL